MPQPNPNQNNMTEAARRRWSEIVSQISGKTGSVAKGQQVANMASRQMPGKRLERDVVKRIGLP